MRTPEQRFTPYAVKFRQVCGALAAYAPSDETKVLLATARALEGATRAGATRMAATLTPEARSALVALAGDEVVTAGRTDAAEALNRLANMIRSNDPNPSEVPT